MTESTITTHINLITIKSLDIHDSKVFYEALFNVIGLTNKETHNGEFYFWGPFGVRIIEQQEYLNKNNPEYRTGVSQISIRVPNRDVVEKVHQKMNENKFKIIWEPNEFPYAEGYYSTCIIDPDGNKFEIISMS